MVTTSFHLTFALYIFVCVRVALIDICVFDTQIKPFQLEYERIFGCDTFNTIHNSDQ